jgi:hypothetical protein
MAPHGPEIPAFSSLTFHLVEGEYGFADGR